MPPPTPGFTPVPAELLQTVQAVNTAPAQQNSPPPEPPLEGLPVALPARLPLTVQAVKVRLLGVNPLKRPAPEPPTELAPLASDAVLLMTAQAVREAVPRLQSPPPTPP